MTITRNSCIEHDAADPVAAPRGAFALPDGVICFGGNSLDARPKAALTHTQEVVANEWDDGLIRSWNQAGWFELPRHLDNELTPLIGAREDEVVVTDTTSISLSKVLAAAIRIRRENAPACKIVVSETRNFPTNLYTAEGLVDLLRGGYKLRLTDSPEELEGALGDDVAVTMLTHVNYRGGHMYDMAAVSVLAHKRGALAIWDLAHSADAMPADLHAGGADYAIGYTCKYLNDGPGSPAFAWVTPALREHFWQPLSGWWSHVRLSTTESRYDVDAGVGHSLYDTQSITPIAMVECGFDIFAQTSMATLRVKSLALTDLFITLVEMRYTGLPLTLITPRNHAIRGSHVGYEHPSGYAAVQALITCGMISDYRESHIMRFGFTPLYTSFADVWDVVEMLRDALETDAWQSAQFNECTLVT